MTVYTCGRNAPCTRTCTRPIHSGLHVRLHRPCTCRHVYAGTRRHVYASAYVSCIRPCARPVYVRAMYTAEDVRTDGPYTVMYTGGVDGPCARPCTGRVYGTAVYGRVRAVFAGEEVFTGRLHGRRVTSTRHVTRPCTRPVRGLTTAVYTAVDGPYTDV